jgi:hypothetical protein
MPIEELSELKNILWTLEVKVQPRIPMILLARSTKK